MVHLVCEPTRRFHFEEPISKLGGYDVYSVHANTPDKICAFASGERVDIGGIRGVWRNEVVATVGANPCIAGVVFVNGVWVLHSLGGALTDEQKQLIQHCNGGLFGGSGVTLAKFAGLFYRRGIQVKQSTDPGADFNLVVVNRRDLEKQFGIRRGIYYGYGVV